MFLGFHNFQYLNAKTTMSEFTLAFAKDLTLLWLCMRPKLKKNLVNLSHVFKNRSPHIMQLFNDLKFP